MIIKMLMHAEDISICTQVCDRNELLSTVLPSWISWGPSEIVIFDMGLEQNAVDLITDEEEYEGIKIIKDLDGEPYSISKGKNCAVRNTKSEWILYLDSDVEITKYFPRELEVGENQYHNKVSGEKSRLIDFLFDVEDTRALTLNEGGLSGSLLISREAYDAVNGLDERMEGYGYEDDDFRNRLALKGYERREMPFGLRHLYHDNASRTVNYFVKNKHESWNRNKMLADMSGWPVDADQQKYRCAVYQGHNYVGEQVL